MGISMLRSEAEKLHRTAADRRVQAQRLVADAASYNANNDFVKAQSNSDQAAKYQAEAQELDQEALEKEQEAMQLEQQLQNLQAQRAQIEADFKRQLDDIDNQIRGLEGTSSSLFF